MPSHDVSEILVLQGGEDVNILIARATSTIGGIWRKRMNGLGDYSDLRGATVILGYHPLRTTRMIREIRAEAGVCRTIVLVSDGDVKIDHSEIRYVRTESLSAREDLLRAGVLEAATVIVYGRDDDHFPRHKPLPTHGLVGEPFGMAGLGATPVAPATGCRS